MTIERQPSNMNFLGPQTHKMIIQRLPLISYFCTEVNIPAITLPAVEDPNPFVKYPVPGDHLDFSELQVSFLVDEDLTNYEELYDWIIALGFPKNFDQFKDISETGRIQGDITTPGVFSDISIFISTSSHNPNREFIFENSFPTSLTDMRFASTDTDVEFVVCTATFHYTKFRLKAKTS